MTNFTMRSNLCVTSEDGFTVELLDPMSVVFSDAKRRICYEVEFAVPNIGYIIYMTSPRKNDHLGEILTISHHETMEIAEKIKSALLFMRGYEVDTVTEHRPMW